VAAAHDFWLIGIPAQRLHLDEYRRFPPLLRGNLEIGQSARAILAVFASVAVSARSSKPGWNPSRYSYTLEQVS
jgi:hypothetical protein